LDIVGPFPHTVGGYRFLYIAINKFTKWPKATPVVKINKQSTIKFIKSIVCRFGGPKQDHHQQQVPVHQWCLPRDREDIGIQICYASVAHLESNGQVEQANAEILKGLKTRTYDGLKKHGKKGIDKLMCAL
jgi:hypothetical protein